MLVRVVPAAVRVVKLINLYDEDAFELVRDLHTAAATLTHLGDNGRDVEVLVLAN